MRNLEILTFPDPRLRTKASVVEDFDDELKIMAKDMLHTMYKANGIGLAATQVNFHKRLIVIDISENQDEPIFIVNPSFKVLDKTIEEYKEGCLSVPKFFEEIYRPKKIKLSYKDLDGNDEELIAEGVLSVCIQHEIDHLDGKLMVDYLSPLKRERIKGKLLKSKTKPKQQVQQRSP